MPELPEIETIRSILDPQLKDLTINDVSVYYENTVLELCRPGFVQNIIGKRIKSVERRGKLLILHLTGLYILLHMRLNGKLYLTDSDEPLGEYSLITFTLSDGRRLNFDDKRKFAKASFSYDLSDESLRYMVKLGIEPFDKNLTAEYLKRNWKHKTCTVKEALLEQSVVAGFGNLYSDDILYLCGISPKKSCTYLSDRNYEDLVKTMPDLMMHAIMSNRCSEEYYNDKRGNVFVGKERSFMYGRAGQQCRSCGTKIRSIKLVGRTCCYCPACQHGVKFIPDNVTPDVLYEAAKFIGYYIENYDSVELHTMVQLNLGVYEFDQVAWEEFVMNVYKYIMTEDAISVSDEKFGEWRKNKSLAIFNMNESNFESGINWIKSRSWRE